MLLREIELFLKVFKATYIKPQGSGLRNNTTKQGWSDWSTWLFCVARWQPHQSIWLMFVIPFISTHGRDATRTYEVFDEIILNIQAETMQVAHKKLFSGLERTKCYPSWEEGRHFDKTKKSHVWRKWGRVCESLSSNLRLTASQIYPKTWLSNVFCTRELYRVSKLRVKVVTWIMQIGRPTHLPKFCGRSMS